MVVERTRTSSGARDGERGAEEKSLHVLKHSAMKIQGSDRSKEQIKSAMSRREVTRMTSYVGISWERLAKSYLLSDMCIPVRQDNLISCTQARAMALKVDILNLVAQTSLGSFGAKAIDSYTRILMLSPFKIHPWTLFNVSSPMASTLKG
jgi:hypothetical protein